MTPRAGFLAVGLCCVGPGFTHHLNLRAYLAAYTAAFQQRLLNSLAPIQQCSAQAASGEHREEEASASHTTALGALSALSLPHSLTASRGAMELACHFWPLKSSGRFCASTKLS